MDAVVSLYQPVRSPKVSEFTQSFIYKHTSGIKQNDFNSTTHKATKKEAKTASEQTKSSVRGVNGSLLGGYRVNIGRSGLSPGLRTFRCKCTSPRLCK